MTGENSRAWASCEAMDKMKDPLVSQAEVKGRFDYDPETGIFTDRATGKPAGKPNAHGYLCVQLGGRRVGIHRVAFMWMLGHWPQHYVDHVNGKVDDNRWFNLRPATGSQNAQNRRAVKSSIEAKGWHKGVEVTSGGRYRVSITADGKCYRIPGSFDSAAQAEKAYRDACHRMFGQFERTVGEATITPPNRDNKTEKEDQLKVLRERRAALVKQLDDVEAAIDALKADANGKTLELVSRKTFEEKRREEKRLEREALMRQRLMAMNQLNKLHPLQK